MKISKILMFFIGVLIAGSATIYTSCVKDPCSGVSCLNGGSCDNGTCVCPLGYNGTRCEYINVTTITFNNNAPTAINLNVNGTTIGIPAGASASYTGEYGNTITASASTAGATGEVINWAATYYTFPATGIDVVPLDVNSNYFYLIINNSSFNTIYTLKVNYGTLAETDESVSVGNGSYGMGYYNAYSSLQIQTIDPVHITTETFYPTGNNNQTLTFSL